MIFSEWEGRRGRWGYEAVLSELLRLRFWVVFGGRIELLKLGLLEFRDFFR